MSTATKSARTNGKVSIPTASDAERDALKAELIATQAANLAEANRVADITDAEFSAANISAAPAALPADPDNATPFQDGLDQTAPSAPAIETIVGGSGDQNTVVFMGIVAELEATISRQRKTIVGYFAERGRIVCNGINVRMALLPTEWVKSRV